MRDDPAGREQIRQEIIGPVREGVRRAYDLGYRQAIEDVVKALADPEHEHFDNVGAWWAEWVADRFKAPEPFPSDEQLAASWQEDEQTCRCGLSPYSDPDCPEHVRDERVPDGTYGGARKQRTCCASFEGQDHWDNCPQRRAPEPPAVIRDVECPFCHASPGEPCVDGSFTMELGASHRARHEVYKQQREAAR